MIKPSGDIITLGKSSVQEGVDEDSGFTFWYFAFEGLEKGSDIEYYYRTEIPRQNSLTGSTLMLQSSSSPKYNVEFELIAPSFLSFAFKSFNGLPDVEKDEDFYDEERTRYFLTVDQMEKYIDQEVENYLEN